jgi:uncharacterized UPF0146 family protein
MLQVFMMREGSSEDGMSSEEGMSTEEGLRVYKLVARNSMDVQEVDVQTTLDRETLKYVLADLLDPSVAT